MQGWWDQARSLRCPWALLGGLEETLWPQPTPWQGCGSQVSSGLGWHSWHFRGWPGPLPPTQSFFRVVTFPSVRDWWGPTASVA